MIFYIESRNTNPHRNLALEQFVFDRLDRKHSYFMLWQNHNSVIIGKHQNTQEEINAEFVKEKNIAVARRLSGGGAVYHDLGNLNFTFITDASQPLAADKTRGIDFAAFCEPICKALRSFGVPVEISGRNDMTVEGKKFSGNAQYIKEGRVMHHGTILYDSDMLMLSKVLKPGKDKIESRGIKSVQSRVTNIRPYMKTDMGIEEFWTAIKLYMMDSFDMKECSLSPEQNTEVEVLYEKVYSQWSWNYGNSPPYTVRKARRIEGCGRIEILLDIGREGVINNIAFYGDFFAKEDPAALGKKLIGHHLDYEELKTLLAEVDAACYVHGLDNETLLNLLV